MATKTQQRMTVGGTSITFTRTAQFAQPDDYDHIIHKDKAGGTIIYTRSSQLEWDVDVICTKAEADTTIRGWITNRSQVVFIPDFTGAPGTTHNTRIMNRTFPLRPWSQSQWRGTLRLRKE
jgi:hypothetical protein